MDARHQALKVLIVDDSDDDATLIQWELRRAGCAVESHRVDTAAALTQALDARPWDIILCDYRMPDFSAPAALALVRSRCRDVPFIIVSATIKHEVALAAMDAGANDFVMKHDLHQLLPTIQREMRRRRSGASCGSLRKAD